MTEGTEVTGVKRCRRRAGLAAVGICARVSLWLEPGKILDGAQASSWWDADT